VQIDRSILMSDIVPLAAGCGGPNIEPSRTDNPEVHRWGGPNIRNGHPGRGGHDIVPVPPDTIPPVNPEQLERERLQRAREKLQEHIKKLMN
jgi:hypothetical protein